MDELSKQAAALHAEIEHACQRLHIADIKTELHELQAASQQPDFWNDTAVAQNTMKQIAKLELRVGPWEKLQKSSADIVELASLGDASMRAELEVQLRSVQQAFDDLKSELKFAGPYDDHDAFLTLSAGAGGTDAQDWTQLLLRMYVRWAERSGLSVTTDEESPGEEAGLKSATIEISGPFAYGKLKGEHGVHRLVRLSPFNADNLRQTSFAKVEVMPKIDKPDDLAIDEKDLKIDVYRSGGHGGQSVNTTDSAARCLRLPSGFSVGQPDLERSYVTAEAAGPCLRCTAREAHVQPRRNVAVQPDD